MGGCSTLCMYICLIVLCCGKFDQFVNKKNPLISQYSDSYSSDTFQNKSLSDIAAIPYIEIWPNYLNEKVDFELFHKHFEMKFMNSFYEGYKNPIHFTSYIIEKTISLVGLKNYKFEIPMIKCGTY